MATPFFSATLSEGTRERESGIKACGKGKKEGFWLCVWAKKETSSPFVPVYS